jgi:hypothetical protein
MTILSIDLNLSIQSLVSTKAIPQIWFRNICGERIPHAQN